MHKIQLSEGFRKVFQFTVIVNVVSEFLTLSVKSIQDVLHLLSQNR